MTDDAWSLIETSGSLGRWSGRPLDDCPYDPVKLAKQYDVWVRGWWLAENEVRRKMGRPK